MARPAARLLGTVLLGAVLLGAVLLGAVLLGAVFPCGKTSRLPPGRGTPFREDSSTAVVWFPETRSVDQNDGR
ncbi:MAG: hypothetical protein CMJ59_05390 [Planctomycetaceae bacterium]|nr:hypothetical protein [Planctomycetaceae bacterium]